MSIALDLALFLRENKLVDAQNKPIEVSAAVRGILFTLMFRLGSNPYAWISQEELSKELSMSLNGTHKLLAKAKKTTLIECMQNPKDKRKNLYRAAYFLINYHLERRESCGKSKKYTPKREDINSEYPHKREGNIRPKGRVFSENETLETAPGKGYKGSKALLNKKENKKKSKATRAEGVDNSKTEIDEKQWKDQNFRKEQNRKNRGEMKAIKDILGQS